AGVAGLQRRTSDRLADIAGDGRRLVPDEAVNHDGRHAAEEIEGKIPGGQPAGGENVDRDEFVVDALLEQGKPGDAHIDAVIGAVEFRPAHLFQADIAFWRFSSILSRKPVVDSHGWSAPIRSARSLVIKPDSTVWMQ